VRITYDPAAGAACIHPAGGPLTPGRTTIQAGSPPGAEAFAALGWKGDRLAGLEVLDASSRLPQASSTKPRPQADHAQRCIAPSAPAQASTSR
jgi:hypothetical protein